MTDLKKNSYFAEFTQQQIREFKKFTTTHTYKKNEIIFFEGEEGNNMFIIKSGMVKLIKMTRNGDEQILNIFKEGDLIAEVVVFDEENYPATAIAMEDSTLFKISQKNIRKLLKTYPEISLNILRVMSSRLRRAQKNVRDLGLKNSTERLAGILSYLGEKYGVREQDKIKLSLSLTQEELANMIGISRETVSRILTKFEKRGLIKTGRKEILLLEPEKLTSPE